MIDMKACKKDFSRWLGASCKIDFFAVQAWINMTTNEMANWPRYKHFHDQETGAFVNPFDKGGLQNMQELCFPSAESFAPSEFPLWFSTNLREGFNWWKDTCVGVMNCIWCYYEMFGGICRTFWTVVHEPIVTNLLDVDLLLIYAWG